jgi:hypothetical protein
MTPPQIAPCAVMGEAPSGQSGASHSAAPEQSRCVPGHAAGACIRGIASASPLGASSDWANDGSASTPRHTDVTGRSHGSHPSAAICAKLTAAAAKQQGHAVDLGQEQPVGTASIHLNCWPSHQAGSRSPTWSYSSSVTGSQIWCISCDRVKNGAGAANRCSSVRRASKPAPPLAWL